MKSEIKIQKPEFAPLELIISVESKRELEFLYAIFNASGNDLRKLVNENRPDATEAFESLPNHYAVFEIIDEHLENLRP